MFNKRKEERAPATMERAEKPEKQKPVKPLCKDCGGQLSMATAVNLKTADGRALVYQACPADCSGVTKKDLAKGARE